MTTVLSKVSKIFLGSFDQTALLPGISDILIVKWNNGHYATTPFLACFGAHAMGASVRIFINNALQNGVDFHIDKYGYVHPMMPDQDMLGLLPLHYGRNVIKFELDNLHSLEAEVYLYSQEDRLLVSDVDGTMTKSDVRGLYHNMKDINYLHEGYYDLIERVERNGYKIVWLTMRSLPLYSFSKTYIQKHTKIDGVLLTEPQEFFPAVKKEIMRKTGNIKTNMMKVLKKLFPHNVNPFVGGLGNRQNDAIAYLAAGIDPCKIFIVDKQSEVHNLAESSKVLTYKQICQNANTYFPKHHLKEIHRERAVRNTPRQLIRRWKSAIKQNFTIKGSGHKI